MQTFDMHQIKQDVTGWEVGYWAMSVRGNKRDYVVSINRDDASLFTVSSHVKTDEYGAAFPNLHIAGHVNSLDEAVDLANETANNLKKHDLYVSIRKDNGVGAKVLVN